jgi:BMFP domain-containing protein YqiC
MSEAFDRIIGRPDKPFHKAECCCVACEDWKAANPPPASEPSGRERFRQWLDDALPKGEWVMPSRDRAIEDAVEAAAEFFGHPAALAGEREEAERLRTRLAEIEAGANADAEDLAKMRDGTKLTRAGVVQVLVWQQQEIRERDAKIKDLEIECLGYKNGNESMGQMLFESRKEANDHAARLAALEAANAALQARLDGVEELPVQWRSGSRRAEDCADELEALAGGGKPALKMDAHDVLDDLKANHEIG